MGKRFFFRNIYKKKGKIAKKTFWALGQKWVILCNDKSDMSVFVDFELFIINSLF